MLNRIHAVQVCDATKLIVVMLLATQKYNIATHSINFCERIKNTNTGCNEKYYFAFIVTAFF
jgi:hypothetical protein